MRDILLKINDVRVVAVCDVYVDRIALVQGYVRMAGQEAKGYTDYKEALNTKGVDAVLITTDWTTHAQIALYAMEKGIAVASEVGSELSLENCYNLVRTQERTGTPYMFMENCCFGKDELLATAMARKNMFGTIVHCSGSYTHELRHEIAYGHVNRHYRFDHYRGRCLENYPTHDLGPIAKLLNINRGNRIVSVSSFASKAASLGEYVQTREDATDEMKNTCFKQGDIIMTVLTCQNGETIVLRLDTTLPTPSGRGFTVRGTKGLFLQDMYCVFRDGEKEYSGKQEYFKHELGNAKKYEEEFLPKIWKEITPEMIEIGHGGMDWFTYNAFVDALQGKAEMPIDVYDSAVWQAVAVLSEISIQQGGMPQAMPDFTNGKWLLRPSKDVCAL